MNKTIHEASTRLLGLLPPDVLHYSLDDLRRFGMPEFIIRRIQLDLIDALTRSITPPSTEWVDVSRHRSVVAWNQYVETISADVHLPRNRAADIIDHAVIETVEIITTPRRRIIEVLFGMSQELKLNELRIRSRCITVHRHIPDSLMRYMELKELQTITRTAAIDIVRKVDERYCASFTPLSWAQSLDPLYQIAGVRVDAELIRDYFIDKDLDQYAQRFENVPHRVERSQLIEILSISDLDNLILDDDRKSTSKIHASEGVEPDVLIPIESKTIVSPTEPSQPTLFEALSQIHEHDNYDFGSEHSNIPYKSSQVLPVESKSGTDFTDDSKDSKASDSLLNAIRHETGLRPELESPFDDALIASSGTYAETEPEIGEDHAIEIREVRAEPKAADIVGITDPSGRSKGETESDAESTGESATESTLNERLSSVSITPIWQRFLDDVPEVADDIVEQSTKRAEHKSISDPEIPGKTGGITLSEWLKPDEKAYIETLFDGDVEGYTIAIGDLSLYQSWSQAQAYLKKKLMPAIGADFHDDLFISFVDQLQHYFSRLPID